MAPTMTGRMKVRADIRGSTDWRWGNRDSSQRLRIRVVLEVVEV